MSAASTSVVIVGGGVAGLTMSALLSKLGVASLLVERRAETSPLPKAHIINQRTMEIFGEVGIADEVYAQGCPPEWMARTIWATSLVGPRPEHGRSIGWLDSWGAGEQLAAHLNASPCRTTNLPQLRLEPILKRQAERSAPDRVLFEHELIALSQDDSGVIATVHDQRAGQNYQVEAQFLIAADGGRTVAPLLGISYEGQRDMLKMITSYVRADMSTVEIDPRATMYWFINPDMQGSIASGVLVKMGGRGWGPHADEFNYHFSTHPSDEHEYTPDEAIARFHRSIGSDTVPVEVMRMNTWTLESVIADRFVDGRVLMVGDAAHRHPPTGALGLNTAIQDVHNLAWKLAVYLRGSAGRALIDSYEAERRPVAIANARQSITSWFAHGEIDAALGLTSDMPPEQGWSLVRTLFANTDVGQEMRDRVAVAIGHTRNEFWAQNLQIGFDYLDGAVMTDGSVAPTPDDPVSGFVPGTWPGHRVPHARITRGGVSYSTYDLCRRGQFVLLLGAEGASWREAAARIAAHFNVAIDVASIDDRGDYADPTGAWARQRGVSNAGAVLVRPDQHVGWRSFEAVDDPPAALSAALETILGLASAHPRGLDHRLGEREGLDGNGAQRAPSEVRPLAQTGLRGRQRQPEPQAHRVERPDAEPGPRGPAQ